MTTSNNPFEGADQASADMLRRTQILDELHEAECKHNELSHAWTRATLAYKRHRRQLFEQLAEVNQLLWDFAKKEGDLLDE